jgi:hypothetical protein
MAVRSEVRVGAFVLLGVLLIAGLVFIIGDARRVFEKKVQYYAQFDDVEGLIPGSMVLMGGVNVGEVRSVKYPDDPRSSRIQVEIAITKSEARRIREDSTITIAPKGLLGDKLLSLSVGHPDKGELPPGSTIPTAQGGGLFSQVEEMGEKAGAAHSPTTIFVRICGKAQRRSAACCRRPSRGKDTFRGCSTIRPRRIGFPRLCKIWKSPLDVWIS